MKITPPLFTFFAGLSIASAAPVDLSRLPAPAGRPVDFAQEIRPLLEKHCLKCHGPEKQKSGWRVDVKETVLRGGDNYAPNVHPGKSAESPLIHFVAGLDEDMVMPQKGDRLTAEQIGLLRAWIDQGAKWPEEGEVTDPKKTHWAFQPVHRPEAPPGSKAIDALIDAKLKERGLARSPEADRRTLIRRLSFDLTGLPPTPEEIEAFVADHAPDAYEKWVDRLLASPRYGERWARHWLDVVRFAESQGFEMNRPRERAWPYRDYVIAAFNDDKPYDQFIREQLAGDALGADEATGFLVGGAFDQVKSPDPVLTAQQRADELHDMVGTTGGAFLGLTVNCARCHNHKFDPISQADYYAVTAVFQGVRHGERALRPPDATARAEQAARSAMNSARRCAVGHLPARGPAAPGAPAGRQCAALGWPSAARRGRSSSRRTASRSYIRQARNAVRRMICDATRLPNLGEAYRYSTATVGNREDFFTWNPKDGALPHLALVGYLDDTRSRCALRPGSRRRSRHHPRPDRNREGEPEQLCRWLPGHPRAETLERLV